MKIILSRKGFDNQYGGQSSPILPDGTLLSLPIPLSNEKHHFRDLQHGNQHLHKIIKNLRPTTHLKPKSTCHLDPDLRKDLIERSDNWQPLFGQADSSLGHLINKDVEKDDLFLFFGSFRQTEKINRKIQYKKNSQIIHLIYGYFQVRELHTDAVYIRNHFDWHPHAQDHFTSKNLNGIFEANKRASFHTELSGSGNFHFHPDLILTKNGHPKSRWDLPEFFKQASISYHSPNSFKDGYFQSAAKGQEFVISANPEIEKWAINTVIKGMRT